MPAPPPANAEALAALERCLAHLRAAHADAQDASALLADGRHQRADELAELVVNALCFCQRLHFLVLGDLHAEGPT